VAEVRIKSPSGKWIATVEVPDIYGKPAGIAKRLRTLGLVAVTQDGVVWVNADTSKVPG